MSSISRLPTPPSERRPLRQSHPLPLLSRKSRLTTIRNRKYLPCIAAAHSSTPPPTQGTLNALSPKKNQRTLRPRKKHALTPPLSHLSQLLSKLAEESISGKVQSKTSSSARLFKRSTTSSTFPPSKTQSALFRRKTPTQPAYTKAGQASISLRRLRKGAPTTSNRPTLFSTILR